MYRRFLAITGSVILFLGLGLAGAKAQDQSSPPPANPPQGQPPQGGMAGGRGMRAPMSPDQMVARLDERLHLNDDQKGKIRSVLEDRQASMEKLRSDTSLSPEDRRAKMRQIFEDHNDQIKNVLNDQQKQQYDQMMERRGRMGNRGGNPPPPPSSGQTPPAPPSNPQL